MTEDRYLTLYGKEMLACLIAHRCDGEALADGLYLYAEIVTPDSMPEIQEMPELPKKKSESQ